MEPPHKRQRLSRKSLTDPTLQNRRNRNDTRLKSIFESIFDKYGKDFAGIGDEIDLRTGEIVVDNGHILSIGNETGKRQTLTLSDEAIGDLSSEYGSQDEDSHGLGSPGGLGDEASGSDSETALQALYVVNSLVQDPGIQSPSATFEKSLKSQIVDYNSEEDELADKAVEWVTPRQAQAIAHEKWQLPEDGPTFMEEAAVKEAWRAPLLPNSSTSCLTASLKENQIVDSTMERENSSALQDAEVGSEIQGFYEAEPNGPDQIHLPRLKVPQCKTKKTRSKITLTSRSPVAPSADTLSQVINEQDCELASSAHSSIDKFIDRSIQDGEEPCLPENLITDLQGIADLDLPFASRFLEELERGFADHSVANRRKESTPVPSSLGETSDGLSFQHNNHREANSVFAQDEQQKSDLVIGQRDVEKPSLSVHAAKAADDAAIRRERCVKRLLHQAHEVFPQYGVSRKAKGEIPPENVASTPPDTNRVILLEKGDMTQSTCSLIQPPNSMDVIAHEDETLTLPAGGLFGDRTATTSTPQASKSAAAETGAMLPIPIYTKSIVQVVIPARRPLITSKPDGTSPKDPTEQYPKESPPSLEECPKDLTSVFAPTPDRVLDDCDLTRSKRNVSEIPDSQPASSSPFEDIEQNNKSSGPEAQPKVADPALATLPPASSPPQIACTVLTDPELIDELSTEFQIQPKISKRQTGSPAARLYPTKDIDTPHEESRMRMLKGSAKKTKAVPLPLVSSDLLDCSDDELSFM